MTRRRPWRRKPHDPRELAGRSLQHAGDLGGRGLQQADDLAAELVERGQGRERPDRRLVQHQLAHQRADDGELVVVLGVLGHDLGGRDRIGAIGDGDRAGEQGVARVTHRAVQRLAGQGVLHHRDPRVFLAQAAAQFGHLRDGEAHVVGHHNGAGVGEDPLQGLDGVRLVCAVHCGLHAAPAGPSGGLKKRSARGGASPRGRIGQTCPRMLGPRGRARRPAWRLLPVSPRWKD